MTLKRLGYWGSMTLKGWAVGLNDTETVGLLGLNDTERLVHWNSMTLKG